MISHLENGAELSDDVHAAHAEVLAERDLEEEERDAAREQGQEVGDEEGSCKGKGSIAPAAVEQNWTCGSG